jgi:lycopene beta-cyclase
MGHDSDFTHVIVGGGLAGGLAALALAEAGRGPGVALVDQQAALGGNHTWSFHETDLDAADRTLVMPLVSWRWPRQTARFPGHERTLDTGYATVTSERFARVVGDRLAHAGVRLLLQRAATSVTAQRVQLDDGSELTADTVLDGRGPAEVRAPAAGYQKFLGLELELDDEGPWTEPVVMDATVSQDEGFRFVYVLPFSRRHVLVEDTVYADTPLLDGAMYERRIAAYLEAAGARLRRVLRRETGVLPLPGDVLETAGGEAEERAVSIGYSGGFFHPVTGYSLPLAARVARAIAAAGTRSQTVTALAEIVQSLEPQRRFERLLNRLMFRAMRAEDRWTALARFYRLPEPTIARFYASRSTRWDRARMLLGRPPRGVAWTRLWSALEEAA